MNKILKTAGAIGLSLLMTNCAISEKDSAGRVIRHETNVKAKAEQTAGIDILIGNKKTDSFQSNNILWKATVESLKFMPTASASYSGGLYVTDWYGPTAREKIKIVVRFMSQELAVNSIEVDAFKRICDPDCVEQPIKSNFPSEIRYKILDKARELNIAAEKKKR
jgi:hypothetical protein